MALIIFLIGLIIGSFLTALTDRWPKEIPLSQGRSKCPKCSAKIVWYDNIPLISYILLVGKCRSCNKKISLRYPLIEATTALLFVSAFVRFDYILDNLFWLQNLPAALSLVVIFLLVSILIAVFVIDLSYSYIPDRLTFWGIGTILIIFLLTNNQSVYIMLLNGLVTALFLLFLHLVTLGKGMGLGDVKLAVFIGSMFTYQLALLWMFLSFVIGSIVGIFMIAMRKAGLRQQIPFGPFLVTSALIVMFYGYQILDFVLPYMF